MKTPDEIGTPSSEVLLAARWTPLFNPGWGREPNDARQNLVDPATHTGPDWIFNLYARDDSGSAVAADPAKNAQILAQAIPALSLPTGANLCKNSTLSGKQFNMPAQFADQSNWPRPAEQGLQLPRWRHSDIDQVAFPYIHSLFEKLVSISNQ